MKDVKPSNKVFREVVTGLKDIFGDYGDLSFVKRKKEKDA